MSKFKELVESLDREGLDELRRSVAEEVGERRQQSAIHMEHIHPGMTDEQKDAAVKEIARVLRGEE
jgi:predicted SAM-dependent methyltransferase